jgi:hypothetical protein
LQGKTTLGCTLYICFRISASDAPLPQRVRSGMSAQIGDGNFGLPCNGSYSADFGPSRGDSRRRAFRPKEQFPGRRLGRYRERVLHYRGDSDSHLVRGLIAIALALYSDHTVREILSSDAQAFFRELGLEQHLTPQRSNGVLAIIERICTDAAASGWAPSPGSLR